MDERIGKKVWMIRLGGSIHEGELIEYGKGEFQRAKVKTEAGYVHQGWNNEICFTRNEAIAKAETEIDGLQCTIYFLEKLVEQLQEEIDLEESNDTQ